MQPALLGVLLLVAGGFGYRALADFYRRPTDSVPIPHGTLAKLPLDLGNWIGQDSPLKEVVIRATDTDDHINRVYHAKDGPEGVAFYVAYGVNLRDLAPHRPEVCYPSAGWTLVTTDAESLPTSDGIHLQCQVHHFRRSGLVAADLTVLNYYIIDDRYCADVSLLRSKALRPTLEARYAAQVQVMSARGSTPAVAGDVVKRFAADSAPLLRALLRDAVAVAESGAARGPTS
ncbi:MAG: EpsI family protein [Phycisphaerales bacterium]|nr:EpsI family protein [Phycisphaerales bacterium]